MVGLNNESIESLAAWQMPRGITGGHQRTAGTVACRVPRRVGTVASVATAVSLRQVTYALACTGIIAKIGLVAWVGHTADWTAGTTALTAVTVVLGLATMILAVVDLIRARGRWSPLVPFVLGLLVFAPVVGYAA